MNSSHLAQFKISPLIGTLDIETHGRREDATIATIGAAVGNILTGEVLASFYIRCITETQTRRSYNKDGS